VKTHPFCFRLRVICFCSSLNNGGLSNTVILKFLTLILITKAIPTFQQFFSGNVNISSFSINGESQKTLFIAASTDKIANHNYFSGTGKIVPISTVALPTVVPPIVFLTPRL
jgi:hypothetical protein